MEEYLKTLLEQIRCKKARNVVEEEIRGHLEEQIEEYQMAGMDPKEAEKAAVLDMGDPVQTGISLDGIHRPRISWKLVILIGVISLLSGLRFYDLCLSSGLQFSGEKCCVGSPGIFSGAAYFKKSGYTG